MVTKGRKRQHKWGEKPIPLPKTTVKYRFYCLMHELGDEKARQIDGQQVGYIISCHEEYANRLLDTYLTPTRKVVK